MRHAVLALFALSSALLNTTLPAAPAAPKSTIVPPPGIAIGAADKAALQSGVAGLGQEIDKLRGELKEKPQLLDLLPDVQIYFNAVDYSLRQDTFYKSNEVAVAKKLLANGMQRVKELRAGQPGWINSTGLVVRGYVSRVDGSVQPYGLVVPPSWKSGTSDKYRLDYWLHGRGETLTEISFINERQTKTGQIAPPETFVLHPYGRYCNAYKFAGEADIFESLEHVKKHYRIDDRRIAMRGFSMGGAGTWHLTVHYPALWAASQPGAGFVETAIYQGLAEKNAMPSWYEQKLWNLTDSTVYAGNLFNCPTLAYNGELDKQRASAALMRKFMEPEGLKLEEIIGPGVEHKFEPKAKIEVDRRMDEMMAKPKNMTPAEIRLTTFSLKYNTAYWLSIEGLGRHWERTKVNATVKDSSNVELKTENVTHLSLNLPAGQTLLAAGKPVSIQLDKSKLTAPAPAPGQPWSVKLQKNGAAWTIAKGGTDRELRKSPGLQGPIDDAFSRSFLIVRPTGTSQSPEIGKWVQAELDDSITQWWRQFRGHPRVKDDTAVTDADIAEHDLILWGDPKSNAVLAKILSKLPLTWDATTLKLGGATGVAASQVPVMIFPNPLNPKRYVVLNTGFTFSEFGSASNSQQTPKLPDWAIIDTTVPRAQRIPKGVVTAGFFDERWQWEKPSGK